MRREQMKIRGCSKDKHGWKQINTDYSESSAPTAIANSDFTILGGVSIGTVTPTLVGPIPELFGTGPGQVGGFVLTPFLVPEPSSIALGALGLASVLLSRRRKS